MGCLIELTPPPPGAAVFRTTDFYQAPCDDPDAPQLLERLDWYGGSVVYMGFRFSDGTVREMTAHYPAAPPLPFDDTDLPW